LIPTAWRGRSVGRVLTYAVLGSWSVVCLLPLYWVAVTTLKQPIDIISGARYLPWIDFKPTLDAWAFILFNPTDDTLGRYVNSIIVAFASTSITIVFGSMAAYGLRRFPVRLSAFFASVVGICIIVAVASPVLGRWTTFAATIVAVIIVFALRRLRPRLRSGEWSLGNAGILAAVLSTRILPPVVTVLPIYYAVSIVGLLDTRTALIATYVAVNMPVAIWLLIGFFDEIPVGVEEAAQLDGASRFRIFFSIAVPMTKAGIFATALLVFVLCWNEYLFSLYLTSDHALTMPPFLAGQMATREQMASADPEWGYFTVLIILMVAPLVVFTGLLQRVVTRTSAR
jgi:multiple sugar transport system permease protein